jgi:alkanesulfonate monooxygenase SsuD/methylene tetrahydromethanopterin reductase-like flavin-dependent oxidoreductase (luciferase family)
VKVGLLVEVEEGLDWDSWRATYTAAERLGFESLWLSDHLESAWGTPARLETWTALAAAATETQRLVLGVLVSPVMFREPAIIARMAETLAALSGGRFVAGLGLGWNADEHAHAGIPFPPVAERARRLVDTITRLRCAHHIPVLVGGSGPRVTLPLAAQHADQWNMTTASVAKFAQANRRLDELCAEANRPARDILRSVACGVLVGRDDVDVRERAQRMREVVPSLADAQHAQDMLQAARQMGWLVGSVEDVGAQLHGFAAAGAERVILGHYDLTNLATLELLAATVLGDVA